MKEGDNFAFIDNQNLYQGVKELGWNLDWKKFRRYLLEKYQVSRAYLFLGYIEENQKMYKFLHNAGFILRFRKVTEDQGRDIKGNVDVLLTMQALLEINEYSQAIIITSDGDFYALVDYLLSKNKLRMVLSPHRKKCSRLLQQSGKEKMEYLNTLQDKIGLKLKSTA